MNPANIENDYKIDFKKNKEPMMTLHLSAQENRVLEWHQAKRLLDGIHSSKEQIVKDMITNTGMKYVRNNNKKRIKLQGDGSVSKNKGPNYNRMATL